MTRMSSRGRGSGDQPPRQCPECGCDSRCRLRDAERWLIASLRYGRQVAKLIDENGRLEARLRALLPSRAGVQRWPGGATPVLVPAQLRVMADMIDQDDPSGDGGVLLAQGDLAAPGCAAFSTERARYVIGPSGAVIAKESHDG